ncbi:MAG: hypothetical protein IMF08_10405 [Proteobacteria bacterium]|nr:hypothetical protein [Pseudomonadota bacterium]
MPRPDFSLQNGETLLYSDAGKWDPPVLSLSLFLFAPAAIILGLTVAPEYLEYPWPELIVFAGLVLFFVPLDTFVLACWFGRWRVIVTDRRVVQRGSPFGLRREELDLARLEDVQHDSRRGRLILVASGHTLTIRCSEILAQEIMKTLIQAGKARP